MQKTQTVSKNIQFSECTVIIYIIDICQVC